MLGEAAAVVRVSLGRISLGPRGESAHGACGGRAAGPRRAESEFASCPPARHARPVNPVRVHNSVVRAHTIPHARTIWSCQPRFFLNRSEFLCVAPEFLTRVHKLSVRAPQWSFRTVKTAIEKPLSFY